jgi:hypothetical protein
MASSPDTTSIPSDRQAGLVVVSGDTKNQLSHGQAMATRIYPAPKLLYPDATAAWFRFQLAANPRLFRPRTVPILTLPAKERDPSQRVEYRTSHRSSDPGTEGQCQVGRSQTDNSQTRILSAEEVKNLLRRHMLKHRETRGRRDRADGRRVREVAPSDCARAPSADRTRLHAPVRGAVPDRGSLGFLPPGRPSVGVALSRPARPAAAAAGQVRTRGRLERMVGLSDVRRAPLHTDHDGQPALVPLRPLPAVADGWDRRPPGRGRASALGAHYLCLGPAPCWVALWVGQSHLDRAPVPHRSV